MNHDGYCLTRQSGLRSAPSTVQQHPKEFPVKSSIAAREITVAGVSEVSQFSIKANGKAFKVLIDGLYSDKALAVVRELCSNAFDSHAEAGKSAVPFDLHLPTNFEPYFSVRDYGTSLSHDHVMRLYTTVFESSKEDSNTTVGKLGLGSKSPFAYTDTFTVTTWKEGKKRSYSAYIGEDYIPQLAFMGEEDTTEPTGLEVSFPTKSSDVYTFISAAQTFCRGLDVLPNLTGNRNQSIKALGDYPSCMDGNGWKLLETGNHAYARQGCVIYPIDRSAVEAKLGVGSSMSILVAPIMVDFPIGEVDIAANREALSYDLATCQNIAKRVSGIMDEIRQKFFGQIAACTTFYEATILYNELLNSVSVPYVVRDAARNKITWRGRKVTGYFDLHDIDKHADKTGDFSLMHVSPNTLSRAKLFKFNRTRYTTIYPGCKIVVQFIEDAVVHVEKRLKHDYMCNGNRNDLVWIKPSRNSNTFKRFLATCGKPSYIDASTLPLPPKDPSKTGPRKKVSVKELKHNGTLTDVDIDVTLGGYYINLERGDVVHTGRTLGVYSAANIVTLAKDLCLIDKDAVVYGISKSINGVLKKSDAWVNALDFIVDAAKVEVAKHPVTEGDRAALAFYEYRQLSTMQSNWYLAANAAIGQPLVAGPFKVLVDYVDEINKAIERVKVGVKLVGLLVELLPDASAYRFATNPSNALVRAHVNKLADAARDKYTLMQLAFDSYAPVNPKLLSAFIEYVNFIDSRYP